MILATSWLMHRFNCSKKACSTAKFKDIIQTMLVHPQCVCINVDTAMLKQDSTSRNIGFAVQGVLIIQQLTVQVGQ